ncbi:transposase [Listeria aquatica]|uniref:Transposase n=1 Tax=Listeria aquatica TaxID=1494960 RepID=A0A841ZPM2_9LIST|nr:transposase [Listeria aquatica]
MNTFNALADFGERFEQYLAAFESEVGSPKNKLDTADLEDLNDRLKTVKASKAQVLELMKSKITQSYVASGYSGSVGQSFDNAMEDINKDIQVLEDYRRFESSHASDFSAVSETWDNIDTYLDRLKKDGAYDASSHTYQSVDFSQEKFYKELSSYNASQKDHYEVQRIAVKTDHGYTYEYRLYKNGLYDPEATDKFNQLQKKAEMDQAKDFFKEVVGINDYIRMVDGIDPLTGKKITHNEQAVSSLMFLLTVVSEATALKILKNMKNGKKILKDVELSQLKTPDKMVEGKVGKKVSGGTGTVWDDIKGTQPPRAGTTIPKSFEINANGEKLWVNPNGTKHMVEYSTRNLSHGRKLTEQQLLRSFQGAVEKATFTEIKFDTKIVIDNWELIFSPPREVGQLPVIKHAVYLP